MKSILNALIVSLSVFLILVACESENIKPQDDYLEYKSKDSIQAEIDFYPTERYDGYAEIDTPLLKLHMEAKEIVHVISNGGDIKIAYSKFIKGNDLIIRFDSLYDVSGDGPYLTFYPPPFIFIDIPEFINKIVLINGNSIDKYQIEISKEKALVNPIDSSFSHLKNETCYRIVENTFVYECDMDTSEMNIYNQFLNNLISNLSIKEFVIQGQVYEPKYYEVRKTKRVIIKNCFQFENKGEFEKAGILLQEFVKEMKLNTNTQTYIRLNNWNNLKYLSWMMPE